MRLIFLDDSEQRTPLRKGLGSLVAIGAVIIEDTQLGPFAQRLLAIKEDLGLPADEEIKWKPSRRSAQAASDGPTITKLREDMLDAALACKVHTAVVVVDHGAVYKSLTTASVGAKILPWMYERIEMCLSDHDDIGVVIADQPGGGAREERRWLAETVALTSNGTKHVQAERVVLPIMTAPSDHLPHLQLADLVTAATTAAVAGRKSGMDLIPKLKAIAHTRSTGETAGAGIVLWPPEIYDLHWWVFGEPHYRKGDVGIPLGPHASSVAAALRTFAEGDGMP